MVMKRNVMRKNLRRTIWKSIGRFIAIVAIIALGAGIFVGLLTTKTDMIATTEKFTNEMNMFHLRLLSTYGWTAEDVAAVSKMYGVQDAEGSISMDLIGRIEGNEDDAVYRLHTIPDRVNTVTLQGGRMPEKIDECLIDGAHMDDSILGTTFTVSEGNDTNSMDSLNATTFKVVGYVSSPLYMDVSRGSTSIGNGQLDTFFYVRPDAFNAEYFTEINLTLTGSYSIYSEELDRAMEQAADRMEAGVTLLAEQRFDGIQGDALAEYNSGLEEYEQGYADFQQARQETLSALADAFQELQDGQEELDANLQPLLDAKQELEQGKIDLDEAENQLVTSRQELETTRTETYDELDQAYADLQAKETEVNNGLKEVNDGLLQINSGIAQIEQGLGQINDGLTQLKDPIEYYELLFASLDELFKGADPETIAQLEALIAADRAKYQELIQQRDQLLTTKGELEAQLKELQQQRQELLDTKDELTAAQTAIANGYQEVADGRAQADQEFANAEAVLAAAEQQIADGRAELEAGWQEYNKGMAEYEEAIKTLEDGWAEYYEGKAEAEAELADAEAELTDAKAELDSAKADIDAMEHPQVYLLDRNTNVGYLAVNSNSDIVAGVSRVFPLFFLLVAALVCITTMTRMVEEERTQIGILKALGYGNQAIINKYLFYTGAAAIVGCGLGVLIGSVVFPHILWTAYGIILNIEADLVLKLNWLLCGIVVVAYTAISMLVTWYCCRRSLREVPAELMRPRSPVAGKKILLEFLPFWGKISFLNKVMFRNVFRYRQRLLMMLLGIGGCTALLLTGFGIRDSIYDIVDHQYAEISTNDMEIYFSEGQSEEAQQHFRDEISGDVEQIMFYYQTSGDISFNGKTKDVSMICAGEEIADFIRMEEDGEALPCPSNGQACITIGIAEALGIKAGDTITIRDADLRQLELEISGVYMNYVGNYLIVSPETLSNQWGQVPAPQMAYIRVNENQDAHSAAAKISKLDGVLNVTVSQDTADQIGSMMGALDLVVITVVVCAGLLGAIVLYNLTNISITERIREIATIKVLGFTSRETAMYVFKENLFLSAMGSVVGLGGGVLLLKFVMSQIKVDFVWFKALIRPTSFLWAVVLTMVCACIVDCLLYFKLEKVNMAEALKSVE